jgi:hypothetical protein
MDTIWREKHIGRYIYRIEITYYGPVFSYPRFYTGDIDLMETYLISRQDVILMSRLCHVTLLS